MAHFAELDENNIVIRVLVTDNNAPNEGYDWLIETFGGNWVQTSYNATIRKNFAASGYFYDSEKDAFIPPKPYENWLLDDESCQWLPPIPYPDDGKKYIWNQEENSWIEKDLEA